MGIRLFFPSPLVGEGGASRSEATGEGFASADRDPSSGAEPVPGRRGAPIRVRHLLPQGEKGGRTAPHGWAQFVFATLGGVACVMKVVASSSAGPSGVGIFIQNGTRMRVPRIGAKAISMLRWAARYLITGRSGM
jgi:hypothetical protein